VALQLGELAVAVALDGGVGRRGGRAGDGWWWPSLAETSTAQPFLLRF
jgi:hypothetical protein